MKLITDLYEDVHVICEGEGAAKRLYVEGIMAQANRPNRNRRNYPKPVLENAIGKFQQLIEKHRGAGELNHPTGPTLNLDRVSHIFEYLRWDGDNVMGRAKISSSPCGQIAKNLIEDGMLLGMSTRGLGSLRVLPSGINEVGQDYMMSAIDMVGDPSAPDAFVQGILEGKEWFLSDGGALQERTKETLRRVKLTEERKLLEFKKFIDSVVNYKD